MKPQEVPARSLISTYACEDYIPTETSWLLLLGPLISAFTGRACRHTRRSRYSLNHDIPPQAVWRLRPRIFCRAIADRKMRSKKP